MRTRQLARWSPERFHLALSRALALFWLRLKWDERDRPAPGYGSFSIDREQMAIEAYSVSVVWVVFMALSLTCLTSHPGDLLLAAIVFVGQIFVLFIVSPLLMVLVSATLRVARYVGPDPASTSRIQSFVFFLVAGATAVLLMFANHCRWLAMTWLGLNLINGLAAALLWLYRARVRELEDLLRQCLPDD